MNIRSYFNEIIARAANPIVVEIGACTGQDTVWLCQPPVSRCIAIEPDPRNFQHLKSRGLPVTLFEGAISHQAGQSLLWMSAGRSRPDWPEHTSSSSILRPTGHLVRHPCYTFDEVVTVNTLTLDDLLAREQLDHIDFIWCDAQGSEAEIVKGGQLALATTRYFYTEFCNLELYEGQLPLAEWIQLLPGRWSVVEMYEEDVLLRNDDFEVGPGETGKQTEEPLASSRRPL